MTGGDNMAAKDIPFQISLAACRVNANCTQEEMAKKLGVSKSSINNWENGKTSPHLKYVKAISKLSGVPIDFIFLPDTLLKVDIFKPS